MLCSLLFHVVAVSVTMLRGLVVVLFGCVVPFLLQFIFLTSFGEFNYESDFVR